VWDNTMNLSLLEELPCILDRSSLSVLGRKDTALRLIDSGTTIFKVRQRFRIFTCFFPQVQSPRSHNNRFGESPSLSKSMAHEIAEQIIILRTIHFRFLTVRLVIVGHANSISLVRYIYNVVLSLLPTRRRTSQSCPDTILR
jgi:hypothetical protein